MIVSWRLISTKNRRDPFTGQGAEKYGGRWNLRGTKIVYSAESRSLGLLEILVNLSDLDKHRLYFAYPIHFQEEDCLDFDIKQLPKHWNNHLPIDETRKIGSAWVEKQQSIVLKVPSIIIPEEYNYLINPEHPEFKKKIILNNKSTILIDPRLL